VLRESNGDGTIRVPGSQPPSPIFSPEGVGGTESTVAVEAASTPAPPPPFPDQSNIDDLLPPEVTQTKAALEREAEDIKPLKAAPADQTLIWVHLANGDRILVWRKWTTRFDHGAKRHVRYPYWERRDLGSRLGPKETAAIVGWTFYKPEHTFTGTLPDGVPPLSAG